METRRTTTTYLIARRASKTICKRGYNPRAMAYRHLLVTRDGPVERVTLNRPEVRNAFNEDMIADLTAWAADVAATPRPGVAVLSGAGPVFCAGADLVCMAKTIGYSRAENVRDAERMARMFAALDTVPIPLVGRIHGAALGGGCGLAAVCDIVVSEEQAVFGFTEVRLGILPAVISPYALAKIGRSAARELFLTGARFSAARALDIGLVHTVVPAGALDAAVDRYVTELLGAGPGAIAAAKALIPRVWERSAAEALPATTEAIAAARITDEAQEGMRAFLEKRRAAWRKD